MDVIEQSLEAMSVHPQLTKITESALETIWPFSARKPEQSGFVD
jgi:hypothetical protein